MKAIIMAGGEGRRLKAITGDIPKPMVSFMGRPMMEHIILLLKENGFEDICVTLGYKANHISDYFGNGDKLGVKLQYRIENEPLGTAGSVKNCANFYGNDDFLVISGDHCKAGGAAFKGLHLHYYGNFGNTFCERRFYVRIAHIGFLSLLQSKGD